MHSALTAVTPHHDTARPRREEPGDLLHREVSVAPTASRIERRSSAPETAYRTAAGRLFIGRTEDRACFVPRSMPGAVACSSSSPRRPSRSCGRRSTATSPATPTPSGSRASPPALTEFLTPDGSIVIELGNGWNPGSPTVSTTGIKALLAFQEAAGLHLCQEFICFNPARLPTPAEWVDGAADARQGRLHARLVARRPHRRPKADNRRVLTEYSESMRKLLKRGHLHRRPAAERTPRRPQVVPHRQRRRDPANVLVPPDSDRWSNRRRCCRSPTPPVADAYHDACRAGNVARHPAAMPELLVEFFVKFLTDPDGCGARSVRGKQHDRLGRGAPRPVVDRDRGRCGLCAVVAGALPGGEEGGVKLFSELSPKPFGQAIGQGLEKMK